MPPKKKSKTTGEDQEESKEVNTELAVVDTTPAKKAKAKNKKSKKKNEATPEGQSQLTTWLKTDKEEEVQKQNDEPNFDLPSDVKVKPPPKKIRKTNEAENCKEEAKK